VTGTARLAVLLLVACRAASPPEAKEPGDSHVPGEAPGRGAGQIPVGPMDAAEQTALGGRVDDLSPGELAAAWPRMDPSSAPAQAVALRLALIAHHRGDRSATREWLARAGQGKRVDELRRAIADQARPADPTRVAVLLPLSGRHAALGREVRLAIELAAAELTGKSRPALRFLDTRGEPEEAERQVDRAAADSAVGLLGPIGQAEARAAAARAVERGLAIGLLAPDDAGAAPDAGVIRLWPSAAWEAAEAARLAVELGHDRLAVFHPRDKQGAIQAESFRLAARAAGVDVVAVDSYDPTATDLEPDVKRLLRLDPASNPRLRAHLARRGRKDGWKSFSPDVPFDLLYIPDEHGPAALVASYLPYFNVEVRNSEVMDTLSLRRKHGGRVPSVVQLLGSSGWYHAGLVPRGGDAVDGALVVVPCAAAAGVGDQASDQAADFADRFEERAGRPPGPVAAQAHDAARVFFAARARAAGQPSPRRALARALATASFSDGACGPAAVGPDGQLERAATLLQVDGGDFVPSDQ
jgi:ABC-type branched-subunit amino acid transport system substrate-binding protein